MDMLLVIMNAATMRCFDDEVQLRMGTNLSVVAGPVGTTEEMLLEPDVGCLSYCCSSLGAFVGILLEGSFLMQNHMANRAFYGQRHHTKDILNGRVSLDGMAINVVQDLHVALFDIEHGQHGDARASIAPLTSHDFEEVASQRRAFEVREKDVSKRVLDGNKDIATT